MRSPAFRFYAGDFLSSPTVQAMDLHEIGSYTVLLLTAWMNDRHGYLPDNDEMLRRWARMSREQWSESREILLSKFPVVEDGWRANPRMVTEAEKQAAFSESQSAKGKRGGRPRKAEEKPGLSSENPQLSPGRANQMPSAGADAIGQTIRGEEKAGASESKAGASKTESPEKPSVSVTVTAFGSSSSYEEESKSADADTPARKRTTTGQQDRPDGPATAEELKETGLEPEDFSAYMAVRRKKRCAFIDTATRERWISRFRNFYAEGKDTRDMLHQMIEGQWQGVVAEKWKQRRQDLVACDDPALVWPELYGNGNGRLQ
ncbi:YdaU family protein [Terriglobus aquaticus]|uniref:YdaU family protein n=1 Tax=Terriglobus aquaticus TaxID=940139 RepID=A0ABW9KK98_9BACT|nr:YdaU family protein [Terriglobus aquaticus]